MTIDNWPILHGCTLTEEVSSEGNMVNIDVLNGTNPTENFFLSNEDVGDHHAGIGMYTAFAEGRYPIPKHWRIPGLTIIFKGAKVSIPDKSERYVAAMMYIKGLIHDSREPDAEWFFRKVLIGPSGKPVMHFGNDDLSAYYRYLVFRAPT